MYFRTLLIFIMTTLLSVGAGYPEPSAIAARLKSADVVLIDVREPAEWAETGVAEPAVLLAMSDLRGSREAWKPFLEKNRDKTLLVMCRSGNRSGQVAALLAKEGYKTENVGAFATWKNAGLPVRKP